MTEVRSFGAVGSLQGLDVYTDANIPTTVGAGTEDEIYVARFRDMVLFESPPRTEVFRDVPVDAGMVGRRVLAHQFHGIPIFLAGFRIERKPGEPFQFAGQIRELAEALWTNGAPEALKGAVDPIVVRFADHRRRGMLANVGQDNAAILRHDRRPGVVLAPHDRALEDFEAIRVVARFAA